MSALPLDPRFAPRMPLEPVNRNDPVADILAQQPFSPGGAVGPVVQMDTVAAPFVWGQGGAQLTPEDLARRRALADAQTQGDYSPVQHWTQGLGRALDGLLGGIETRKLDKASAEMKRSSDQAIIDALGKDADLAPLLTSGNKASAAIVDNLLSQRNPKPVNNDTVADFDFMTKQLGPDAAQQYLRSKANPIQWIQADNGDGTKTLVPMGSSGPLNMQGGGGQASSGPDWTSAFSPEELRVMKAEAARRGGSTNIPQGSPLQGGPQPGAVVDGYRFKGGNPNDQASWEAVR